MGQIELGWGLDVILWFQSWRTPLIETLGLFFHFAGSEDFYLILLPLIYWCIDARLGRQLSLFFMIAAWSNAWLKAWWKRPRPFQVSPEVRNVVTETSYGLPSGHAHLSTALWGGIALEVRRRWATLLIALYLLLMALSRMALGVHFPQDVIGGLLIGLASVAVYAWSLPKLGAWLEDRGLWVQIGLVVVVTALMLIIHPGLIPVTSPDGLAGAVTPAGAFLGMGIGFALEVRSVRFDARGRLWKRLLRFLIGMIGVMILRFGLGALFGGLEPALIFRLVRYGLIGLWAGFGAPWVFVKARLADRRIE
ncbi:MAG TPA: phosphatase PAP2 family protein [Chloroflexi bacterium]|nr:phosphatase PAP2 family protein [Chloroflexota bacterium]